MSFPDYGGTQTGGGEAPLTMEVLREALEKLPRPIGYALLRASYHVDKIYRLDNSIEIGSHVYMLVVPNHMLHQLVVALGASSYLPIEGCYRFDVFAQKPKPMGVVNFEQMA